MPSQEFTLFADAASPSPGEAAGQRKEQALQRWRGPGEQQDLPSSRPDPRVDHEALSFALEAQPIAHDRVVTSSCWGPLTTIRPVVGKIGDRFAHPIGEDLDRGQRTHADGDLAYPAVLIELEV